MKITEKLAAGIEHLEAERRQMVASVRRAYDSGRWQAATPAQRARTRSGFRVNRSRRLRAEQELGKRR